MAGGLGATIREAHRRLELDARSFLNTLYRGQPDGTLIAVGPLRRPHFVASTGDALPYVLGAHDVYARITLLGARPERRGSAADSVYLPGVWAEVDVNGGPRAAGGLVDDGAANLDMALELAHAVLQPTLTVRSGYGLHAYWLFEAMLDVRDAEARERAGRLVEGWQRRLRAAAADLGIRGLDATHDLARVLRPAGTFNGKGAEPTAVELVDDGGPRYAVEQIAAEVLAPVVTIAPVVPAVANGTPRTVDELVARYSSLGRIARREGKAPKGGSASDWDYYLACEARRRVKGPPITRGEALELVAYGRGFGDDPRGKGSRRDYLERTVDRAFAEVPAPGEPAATPAVLTPDTAAALVTAEWRAGDDPIVGGRSSGYGAEAILYLRRRSGAVAHFPRYGDLFVPARHVEHVTISVRSPVPNLDKPKALRLAQALAVLCDVRYDDGENDRDEVALWADAFVFGLGHIFEGDLFGEGEPRWRVLVAQRDYLPPLEGAGIAASTAGIRDLDGRLWIPSGEFMRHIRQVERASINWKGLGSRLDDLGWAVHKVDVREPGVAREGADHIRRVYYGEPGRFDS